MTSSVRESRLSPKAVTNTTDGVARLKSSTVESSSRVRYFTLGRAAARAAGGDNGEQGNIGESESSRAPAPAQARWASEGEEEVEEEEVEEEVEVEEDVNVVDADAE